MLRYETKEKCIKILEDIAWLCAEGVQKDAITLISVLQEAQDAVITVGERLEKEAEDVKEIISQMETLCELFYLLSQNVDDRAAYGAQIDRTLGQIMASVSELPTCYQIVFFPYKAEMWDSLESVWLACKEDSRCDCKVVPIPYYSFDAKKNVWVYHYEMNRFPADVPVVHYLDYDLSEGADAAFIHNPYDEYNYVTHVYSDYYSYHLKKYVKKLFYVPYYVSSGGVSKGKSMLSAFAHADYLMLQSEYFKEGMKEHEHYRKAVVVGSPKLDRVIRLCREGGAIPEEWSAVLDGKKSLMLNTSISTFLQDGEAYLDKLLYLFESVKKRDDVAIVWRPHPLLQSTLESMLPHLLNRYLDLQRYFIEEKVGILDDTPDVTNTVAITDGYIGEAASSVTTLFEVAGKPLFILNNYVRASFSEEECQRMYFADCEKVGDDYWAIAADSGSVFVAEAQNWKAIKRKENSECGAKWSSTAWRMARKGDEIYFSPRSVSDFFSYCMITGEIKKLSDEQSEVYLSYRAAITYKNKLFYLPNVMKYIAEYNIASGTWKRHEEPILALQKKAVMEIFEDVYGYFVQDKDIWITNLYSNCVLRFDMETGAFQIYALGEESVSYAAIAVAEGRLYVSEAHTGDISVWDISTMCHIETFVMPKEWQTFRTVQGRAVAHDRLIVTSDSIVAVPRYANVLVRVDLQTGEVSSLAEEFWQDVVRPANNYKPDAHAVVNFTKLIDENTLLIQKRRDASLLELNVQNWEYQVHHPSLAEGELEKWLEEEDGFEKTNTIFARRESRYFSFEDFLDDLVNERFDDAMERQKEAMKTIAVNLDGTCGEKIHEFMMDVLLDKTIKYKR